MKQIKKKITAGVMVLIGAAVLTAGGYYTWLNTPPPMPTTVQEAGALLVSPRYMRLPETRRLDYMARASELYDKATPQERQAMLAKAKKNPNSKKALKKAMQDRIIMAVRDYAKADDFTRRSIIDKAVAIQQMFAARQSKRDPKRDFKRKPETDAHRQARQDRFMGKLEKQIETGNPQHQAYVGEFITAMMKRRVELGLTPLPFDPKDIR